LPLIKRFRTTKNVHLNLMTFLTCPRGVIQCRARSGSSALHSCVILFALGAFCIAFHYYQSLFLQFRLSKLSLFLARSNRSHLRLTLDLTLQLSLIQII
jgi:O-antigen ligase